MNRGPGDQLPDYELPDHESVPRKLSHIQGDNPLILTLARGHYCPKEHQQHLELVGASHVVGVSHAEETAGMILEAARPRSTAEV